MSPAIAPVPGAPALSVTSRGATALLIADLHLGLGGTAGEPAGPPGGSAAQLASRLIALAEAARARTIVVAGDVKHPIVGTPPTLRPVVFGFFATLLDAGLGVEVVLGNHDAGLTRYLPREVAVHPAEGIVRGGVGIFHGHRWPSRAVLNAPRWFAGHLHPGVRFAPTAEEPDGKRPCWLRAILARPPPVPGRPLRRGSRELLIVPPFNPLAGLEALNRERPARGRTFLYGRFLAHARMRAYLLDGTDVGAVVTRPALRARSGRTARRGR